MKWMKMVSPFTHSSLPGLAGLQLLAVSSRDSANSSCL